jgi:hypothetical protein
VRDWLITAAFVVVIVVAVGALILFSLTGSVNG